MDIRLDISPFEEPVTNLLRELSELKFFGHGLLIGSWPMVVYAKHFTLMYGFATGDIDFAVTGAMRLPEAPRETIPELMERLGYSSLQDYSGIETYLRDGFEVEFITHRRGGRGPAALVLQPWKISAQPLPFIDLLFIRPVTVALEGFDICIPSPESLMLHKLIIAQRRTGRDKESKKEKDLQQCEALATICRTEEVQRLLGDYRPGREPRRDIETSCRELEITLPGGFPWQVQGKNSLG